MTREQVLKKYPEYKFVGCVNYNQTAFDAYRESNKHEAFKVDRCMEMVVLHDLKQIVSLDFGD